MSFEYRDFLHLAQELAGKSPTKPVTEAARLRSAISRAYYATFFQARYYLATYTTTIPTKSGDDHKTVRNIFKYDRTDGKKRKIGSALETLLQHRTWTDYDDEFPVLNNTLIETLLLRAEDTLKWLDELEQKEQKKSK
jgi:uncharacterized protein (UPF0332 family)